jgi:hypothetical protein
MSYGMERDLFVQKRPEHIVGLIYWDARDRALDPQATYTGLLDTALACAVLWYTPLLILIFNSLSSIHREHKGGMLINNFIYLIASLFSLSAGEREREWWREIRHLVAEIYQCLGPCGGLWLL